MSEIPDGPPIPMSDFTLGGRYGSEDMYRDMGIVPGSRVSIEKDGVVYTDTVQEVTYTSPAPAIYRQLSGWQRFMRRLTPRRLRKSLLIRPAKLGGVSLKTRAVDDEIGIDELNRALRGFGFPKWMEKQ